MEDETLRVLSPAERLLLLELLLKVSGEKGGGKRR
jgi:hypothetical protein